MTVEIVVRPKYGRLTDAEKRAMVAGVEHAGVVQLRVDEALVYKLDLEDGHAGLPIIVEVWLTGDMSDAIDTAVKPVVDALQKRMAQLTLVLHRFDDEPARYVLDRLADADAAIEAVADDFEIMTHVQTHVRVWREGHWESSEAEPTDPRNERRRRTDRRRGSDRRR